MASLFEIGINYQVLNDLMNDVSFNQDTGEVINEDEAIASLFESIEDELSNKLDSCNYVIKQNKSNADMLRAEAKRLTSKAVALDNKTKVLKSLMLGALTLAGGKIKTDKFSFYTMNSKSVEADENELSREWLKIKYEADKTKIKKALLDSTPKIGFEYKKDEDIYIVTELFEDQVLLQLKDKALDLRLSLNTLLDEYELIKGATIDGAKIIERTNLGVR